MTTDAPGEPHARDDARRTGSPEDSEGSERSDALDESSGERERKHLPVWQESILLLGIALVLAVVIKTFFVQAFYIPSESMEPGLIRNDRILVQKVSYWFGGDPARGDVVVFEDPGGWLTGEEPAPTGLANVLSKIGLYPTGGHLVKRVVGTEGDVVECCDEKGRILVNGEPVDESSYVAERKTCAGAGTGFGCDWQVGPVPEGKVFSLVWPRERWDWVSNPGVFDDVPDDPPSGD